jgi:O-antigen/teichoic acid export membrane protein
MMVSLAKRYVYKLTTNTLGLFLSLGVQSIVPRTLGPDRYGVFVYLINFFSQVMDFLDSGSSIGYFGKISQRPQEKTLLTFYLLYIGFVCLSIMALTVGAGVFGIHKWLWPGQALLFVWMSLFFVILNKCVQVFGWTVDAYALTVQGEISKVVQKCISLSVLFVLSLGGWLTLTTFYLIQYLSLCLLLVMLVVVLNRGGINGFFLTELKADQVRGYFKEFYSYTAPLFVLGVFTMGVGLLDRWILQKLFGSTEQGYFGFAFQISSYCLIISGAMSAPIMREYSVRFGAGDREGVRRLFEQYVPPLYCATIVVCAFCSVWSEAIVLLMGGGGFKSASASLAVLALYPALQVYGQLNGSILYIMGETAAVRRYGIVALYLDIPLTLFLLGPKQWFGLNLGAEGLAIKTVVVSWVSVVLQMRYTARLFAFPFGKFMWHQVAPLATFACLAKLIAWGVGALDLASSFSLLSGGGIYALATLLATFTAPQFFLMKSRSELNCQLANFFSKMRRAS